MNKLKIKLKSPDVKPPTYSTDGAGCFDIRATTFTYDGTGYHKDWVISVTKNDPITFGTGLFFEVPKGKVMLVFSRSGHGFKNDVRLANCVGVIDSDYRGELMVKLTNDNEDDLVVNEGDRIAQAMLIDVEQVQFEIVEQLSDTERGTGGLGSTGVK